MTADHMVPVLNHAARRCSVAKVMRHLNPHKEHFSHIAITGYSAAIIGSIVAHKLKKNLVIVRKPDEQCNSEYNIEQYGLLGKYVFVDDLICTGDTLIRIFNTLGHENCYGVYTYQEEPRLIWEPNKPIYRLL